jgi:hypothetical protein
VITGSSTNVRRRDVGAVSALGVRWSAVPERFFLNVALVRVLYAYALVAAPRLALGRFAALCRILGDPELGMAGAFLWPARVLWYGRLLEIDVVP